MFITFVIGNYALLNILQFFCMRCFLLLCSFSRRWETNKIVLCFLSSSVTHFVKAFFSTHFFYIGISYNFSTLIFKNQQKKICQTSIFKHSLFTQVCFMYTNIMLNISFLITHFETLKLIILHLFYLFAFFLCLFKLYSH